MTAPSVPGGQDPARAWPVRHPRAAFLGLVLLAAVGAVCALRLPPDRVGSTAAPTVVVAGALPGLGAAVVERELARPLEEALADLPGVREIEARSRAGEAEIRLRFDSAAARDQALPEVRRRLAVRAALLPSGAPVVARPASGAFPAAVYSVAAAEFSEATIDWIRTAFADPLREFPQAAEIAIAGLARREVLVQPDPARLAALGLDFDDLLGALRNEAEGPRNRASVPPGSTEAIAARTVQLPNGAPIALAEVAEISIERRRPQQRREGAPLRVTVLAASPSAAVNVAERVAAHLAWLRANDLVPRAITVQRLHDESQAARTWRARVLARIVFCVAVVLLLLSLVFGVRLAAVAALGFAVWLPVTLAALWTLGFTLDLRTAGGLLLACVPFALLAVLPFSQKVYAATLLGAAGLWTAALALGVPYARAGAVVPVATLCAAPVRWLIAPWLPPGRQGTGLLPRLWPGGPGVLPARMAAWTAAGFVATAVAVSLYALPAVRADITEGTLRVRVRGEDERRVAVIAGSLLPGLHAIPRVSEVRSSASLVETWRLRLDRERMAALGIGLAEAGRAFAIAREGVIAGEIVSGETRLPLRVRLAPGAAGEGFERLLLRAGGRNAPTVRLRDVGVAERVPQPRARLRISGLPAAEIRARWRARDARADLLRYCRRLEIPEGYDADCRVIDSPVHVVSID